MPRAKVILDTDYRIGAVDPRLFGSFIEHVGRCVTTGLYEPGHVTADAEGFRTDVLELAREAKIPVYRYPGGCFLSGYRWEDGVGPRRDRPRRLDLAWRALETNEIGTNEFASWARKAEAEVYMAVNVATRDLHAAPDLVEYCNHPGGTALSDLRRSHGVEQPHRFRLWGLDNELDGPWEIGFKDAAEYGRKAFETAKLMRRVDPSIEIVAVGSSNLQMKTFAEWDRVVLEYAYENVDYLAPHKYVGGPHGQAGSTGRDLLAQSLELDEFLTAIEATCDHVKARLGSRKTMQLCVDEWNVWHSKNISTMYGDYGAGTGPEWKDREDIEPWSVGARLMEDVYTVEDALALGTMILAFLRHSDRVRIACLSTLVNNVGALMTEPGGPVWRQTTWFPFQQASTHAKGDSLLLQLESDSHDTPGFGPVPLLDAAATIDEGQGHLAVFAVNRCDTGPLDLTVDIRGSSDWAVLEHIVLTDDDPHASNTLEHQNRISPRLLEGSRVTDGKLETILPPLSWNVIRLASNRGSIARAHPSG